MSRDSIIDSRDLLNELRDLLNDPTYDYSDTPPADALAELDAEDRELVETLRGVLDELPESTVDSPTGNSWGSTLVADYAFEDYARELATDIGAISGNEQWPLSYIDWERAASALSQDYTTVELDGTTYYAR